MLDSRPYSLGLIPGERGSWNPSQTTLAWGVGTTARLWFSLGWQSVNLVLGGWEGKVQESCFGVFRLRRKEGGEGRGGSIGYACLTTTTTTTLFIPITTELQSSA